MIPAELRIEAGAIKGIQARLERRSRAMGRQLKLVSPA